MKSWVKPICVVVLLVSCLFPSLRAETATKGLANEFFAMDTGTIDANHRTAEAQVKMLKELGYAGIGYWQGNPKRGKDGMVEMLTALDKYGPKAYPVYFGVCLDRDKPTYERGLKEAIELLKGRDTAIWVHITSEKYKMPDGERRAVEILRTLADMAHESGVKIALYPHINEWLEKVDDAVRLAEKVNRRNLGVSFNLFHWLRVEGAEGMEGLMEKAMPYLFYVTINGSSNEASIETLDKGEFDIYRFLKTLNELGYRGPVGLQGWGIKGDVEENLKRSMAAWQKLSAQIAAECDK